MSEFKIVEKHRLAELLRDQCKYYLKIDNKTIYDKVPLEDMTYKEMLDKDDDWWTTLFGTYDV